ncbi:hypothetical protein [Streptomyces sp. NPDC004296]|uniref:hypothetical protein n=1 Tax=Streptomyces sp. NPDC004296 TaxID=3364697 RepID=UPI0036C57D4A
MPKRSSHPATAPGAPEGAAPLKIDLPEYTRLAWNGLTSPTIPGRRAEAVAAARTFLTEAITLPLEKMSGDETALALIQLRAVLARLLAATDRSLTPPDPRASGERAEAEDLCASLLDLIAGTPALAADITIHLDIPLPADLIGALARAIDAPGLRANGSVAEAVGSCGSSTIHLTAPVLGHVA